MAWVQSETDGQVVDMVADAVVVEPVSASNLPDNRENSRVNFEGSGPQQAILTSSTRANSITSSEIPCEGYREFFQ